jgi:hypothetical protein
MGVLNGNNCVGEINPMLQQVGPRLGRIPLKILGNHRMYKCAPMSRKHGGIYAGNELLMHAHWRHIWTSRFLY